MTDRLIFENLESTKKNISIMISEHKRMPNIKLITKLLDLTFYQKKKRDSGQYNNWTIDSCLFHELQMILKFERLTETSTTWGENITFNQNNKLWIFASYYFVDHRNILYYIQKLLVGLEDQSNCPLVTALNMKILAT